MNALSIHDLRSIARESKVGIVSDIRDNNSFTIKCRSSSKQNYLIAICLNDEIIITTTVEVCTRLENMLGVGHAFCMELFNIQTEADVYFSNLIECQG